MLGLVVKLLDILLYIVADCVIISSRRTYEREEYKLIGSAPTLELLIKRLQEYFYSESVNIVETTVYVSDKPIEGFRVIKKANRFRFELILKN